MASFNKVMLMGNLTRDPEVRYTPKGSAVAEIGLAVNRRFRVDDETREETTFVDITFWGRQAETIGQYMRKGRPIFIEGRLQLDSWEDKTSGQKRSRLRVVGENFQFIGSRGDDDSGGGGGSYSQSAPDRGSESRPYGDDEPGGSSGSGGSGDIEESEDDIPF